MNDEEEQRYFRLTALVSSVLKGNSNAGLIFKGAYFKSLRFFEIHRGVIRSFMWYEAFATSTSTETSSDRVVNGVKLRVSETFWDWVM